MAIANENYLSKIYNGTQQQIPVVIHECTKVWPASKKENPGRILASKTIDEGMIPNVKQKS